jgi:hypothetical protein
MNSPIKKGFKLMYLKNVRKLLPSTFFAVYLIFGLQNFPSRKCLASPQDYVGHTVDTSSVSADCPECPTQLLIAEKTVAHSLQHYPGAAVTGENIANVARSGKSTTVLNGQNDLDLVLNTLTQDSSVIWTLDKRARQLLLEDADTIAYSARVLMPSDSKVDFTQFLVVFCRHEKCDDDAGGVITQSVFNNRDIISIYPICGPDVIEIPRKESLKGKFKSRKKPCK